MPTCISNAQTKGFPDGSAGKKKKSACNAGDKEDECSGQEDPNPRLERSPRGESGNPLCFMDHTLSWWQGLHNSMRLWAMPCRANQDRWVIVKSSNKTRSTGGGNGNPLQYSCLENPRTWVRVWRAKRCDWKMSPSGWQAPYMSLGKSRGQLPTAPERIKHLGQSKNNAQLWMCPVVKVKFDVVKNNIA